MIEAGLLICRGAYWVCLVLLSGTLGGIGAGLIVCVRSGDTLRMWWEMIAKEPFSFDA